LIIEDAPRRNELESGLIFEEEVGEEGTRWGKLEPSNDDVTTVHQAQWGESQGKLKGTEKC